MSAHTVVHVDSLGSEPFNYVVRGVEQLTIPTSLVASFQKEAESATRQRRTLASNAKYIAYTMPQHPNARVVNKFNTNRALLRGHSQVILDITFVSFLCDVVCTAGADGVVAVHNVTESADGSVRVDILGTFEVGEGRVPWGLAAAVPPLAESLETVAAGNLLVATTPYKLTAFSIKAIISKTEQQHVYEIPNVQLGECNPDFSVSADGSRVVVAHEATVSVYLLPSPAKHANWQPHSGEIVNAVSFGPDNNVIVTCSRDNGLVRVWNMSDITPHCIQTLCLGDGSAKWKVQFDLFRNFAFFGLCADKTVLVLSLPPSTCADKGFDTITELALDRQLGPSMLCTARRKDPSDPSLILRFEEKVETISLVADMFKASIQPQRQKSSSQAAPEYNLSSLLERLGMQNEREVMVGAGGQPHHQNHHGGHHHPHPEAHPQRRAVSEDELISRMRAQSGGATPVVQQVVQPQVIVQMGQGEPQLQMPAQVQHQMQVQMQPQYVQPMFDIDALLDDVAVVTGSLVRATQKIAEFNQVVKALASEAHKSQERHATVLSSRVAGPLESLASMSAQSQGGKPQTNAELLAPLAKEMQGVNTRVDELVRTQVSGYGSSLVATVRQGIQAAKIPTSIDVAADTKGSITTLMRQIKESVRCDQLSASVSELTRAVNIKAQPSVKDAVIQHLAQKNLDGALSLVLDQRRPELLMWLLLEAKPLSDWEDAAIDVALNPISVLSMVQNLCAALGTAPKSLSPGITSQLVGFLRNCAFSFNSAWKEAVSPEIYAEIRGLCIGSLQTFQNNSEPTTEDLKALKNIQRILQI